MNKAFRYPKKLFDTARIPQMGRVDISWYGAILSNAFGSVRKGEDLPKSFKFWDPDFLLEHFGLNAIEFGNWLNQEDRYTYMAGTAVSLHDASKILKLKPIQMGFAGKLSIAHGARGRSRAMAHFEPARFAINITRYNRESKQVKSSSRYFFTGGVGALGHEWAHALDFYLGRASKQPVNYLTHSFSLEPVKGSSGEQLTVKVPGEESCKAMSEVMKAILLDAVRGKAGVFKPNKFYGELLRLYRNGEIRDYWLRSHELFARAFEVFLLVESKRMKIENPYLRSQKYAELYPSEALIAKVAPKMRKLLALAAKTIPAR